MVKFLKTFLTPPRLRRSGQHLCLSSPFFPITTNREDSFLCPFFLPVTTQLLVESRLSRFLNSNQAPPRLDQRSHFSPPWPFAAHPIPFLSLFPPADKTSFVFLIFLCEDSFVRSRRDTPCLLIFLRPCRNLLLSSHFQTSECVPNR